MIVAIVTLANETLHGTGESVLGSLKDALKGKEQEEVMDTKFYHDRYMMPVNQRSIRRALASLSGKEIK